MKRIAFMVARLLTLMLLVGPTSTLRVVSQSRVVEPADRTILPIPEPNVPKSTVFNARNATPPPRFEVKAPAAAPNVLIVLIDDMGFGMSEAFGGPIHMPTATRLANDGLRYNQFHTTALCSPTRAALMSGRNHHSANFGSIAETATSFPGQTGQRPNSVAYLAEMVRLNGYSTAQFGKNHATAPWEVRPSGPTNRWPTRSGFDKFYGFMGGETNQWAPFLYDGMTPVELPKDPNYHFMTDMTDKAISWMSAEKSLTPDKPFFMYFAPGATHAPHHVPTEWSDKYKGKFDQGWDALREETLARQKELGVVPADTELPDNAFPKWDSLSETEKRLYARQMETYAGYSENADWNVGRVLDAIEEMGELDNTLVIWIWGDNGASLEGTLSGTFNEMTTLNGIPRTPERQMGLLFKHGGLEAWGGELMAPHYSAGWAWAGNAPFDWGRQVASHLGGTRNPLVVRYPKAIADPGALRSHFTHVIDIAPTVLEIAGITAPTR